MTTPANANGHRRRQLVKRVLAEETHCALCGGWVDKTLRMTPGQHSPRCPQNGTCTGCKPHPMRAEVDEDLPRSRGGSPYNRANCHLMHRKCNADKRALTIAEYKTRQAARNDANTAKTITNNIQW